MDGNLNIDLDSGRRLPALPDVVANVIAVDLKGRRILVEPHTRRNAHFLTWLDRCREIGLHFEPVPAEHDEIMLAKNAEHHEHHSLDDDDALTGDNDLEYREAARSLLKRGADYGATDISIHTGGKRADVQFRVKGEIRTVTSWTQKKAEAIMRAFYQGIAVEKDASFTPLETQYGQISGEVLRDTGLISVRITRGACYPVESEGGFMLLRLQPAPAGTGTSTKPAVPLKPLKTPRVPEGTFDPERLGLSAVQSSRLKRILQFESGLLPVMAPMGHGKTTLIYEMLKERFRRNPGKRIITIEDPVEFGMFFAIQRSIPNARADLFADYFQSGLRMDAQTILLGEIRSAEAFLAALEAAYAGHWIPHTAHVIEPYSFADRFEMLDPARIRRKMFCNTTLIPGLIYQRLVPHLCPHCSKTFSDATKHLLDPWTLDALKSYGNLADVRFRSDEGCDACRGGVPGLSHRSAVAEVIETDPDLMNDIMDQDRGAAVARKRFRERSDTDKSVLSQTMDRVLAGSVDPRDVKSVGVIVPNERVNL